MTKPRIIIFATIGLLLVAGLVWPHHDGPQEPLYQGKPLGKWLAEVDLKTGNLSAPSIEAMRQVGTNAIPWLLMEATAHDPALKSLLVDILRRRQSLLRIHIETEFDHQLRARRGLTALGLAGGLAVSQGLTNSNKWIRFACVGQWEVGKLYHEMYLPPLLNCLNDPEPMIRARAANAIGMVNQQPDKAIPALITSLGDPDPWVRNMAALGLGCYGKQATSAVPVILRHLTNSTSDFDYFATNALKAINPAALPIPTAAPPRPL